jgi:hypothetical protein
VEREVLGGSLYLYRRHRQWAGCYLFVHFPSRAAQSIPARGLVAVFLACPAGQVDQLKMLRRSIRILLELGIHPADLLARCRAAGAKENSLVGLAIEAEIARAHNAMIARNS